MTTTALFVIAAVLFLGFLVVAIQLSTMLDYMRAWVEWDTRHRASIERNKDA